jgi:hypothetical protein
MASRVSYYRCMWLPELIDGLTATPANSFERGNRVTSAPRLGFPATLGPLFHAEANPSRPAAVLALRLSEREARARSSELRGRKMSRRRVLKQPHASRRDADENIAEAASFATCCAALTATTWGTTSSTRGTGGRAMSSLTRRAAASAL